MATDQPSRVLTCAVCGPIPEQPLYSLGTDHPVLCHSILVREGQPMSYYGPQPPEYEPCGPVVALPTEDLTVIAPASTSVSGDPS